MNIRDIKMKNGFGKCSLNFELKSIFSKYPLLTWESSYNGIWKQGKKHGLGTFTSLSNNKYWGDWNEDLRDGTGTFEISDGTRFFGTWTKDKFTGNNNQLTVVIKKSKYMEAPNYLNQSTFVGQVEDGLMDGKGLITFGRAPQDKDHPSPERTIHGRFRHGCFNGQGSIVLESGILVHIEELANGWEFGKYSANGILTTELPTIGKVVRYEWNGRELKSIEEGILVISLAATNINISRENPSPQVIAQEVFDILSALKWFEFHFIFGKHYLGDIYTFEHVDHTDATEATSKNVNKLDL